AHFAKPNEADFRSGAHGRRGADPFWPGRGLRPCIAAHSVTMGARVPVLFSGSLTLESHMRSPFTRCFAAAALAVAVAAPVGAQAPGAAAGSPGKGACPRPGTRPRRASRS